MNPVDLAVNVERALIVGEALALAQKWLAAVRDERAGEAFLSVFPTPRHFADSRWSREGGLFEQMTDADHEAAYRVLEAVEDAIKA